MISLNNDDTYSCCWKYDDYRRGWVGCAGDFIADEKLAEQRMQPIIGADNRVYFEPYAESVQQPAALRGTEKPFFCEAWCPSWGYEACTCDLEDRRAAWDKANPSPLPQARAGRPSWLRRLLARIW